MELNRRNVKRILLIAASIILLYSAFQNLDVVLKGGLYLVGLVFPFMLGGAIAFILNVPMSAIERGLFPEKRVKGKMIARFKRAISLVLTFILVVGILFSVTFIIVPEVGSSLSYLGSLLPDFMVEVQQWSMDLLDKYPEVVAEIASIKLDWKEIGDSIWNFLRTSTSSVIGGTISFASSVIGGTVNFFLGLVFAIYILLQKERLASQLKRLFYAYLPTKRVDYIIEVLTISKTTFSKFLSGQCIEAVILGSMFFIAMTIFKLPQVMTISVLIAFTALIPVFGAFIGCAIGVFFILIVSPIKALWFLVLFIVLQQLEGNLIYPYVVGNSVGLPSIWVLCAVTIGGSLMGVVGMLVFIPLTSVVYALLRKNVRKKLKEKDISVE